MKVKPTLLAVFAHPDDETFRTGGTLTLLAQTGVRIHILTFTRGQAGSCGVPPLCSSEELPMLRGRELACACRVLGVQQLTLLDYEDGRLDQVPLDVLAEEIMKLAGATQPQVMLSFGPDGLSGHPDHIQAGQAAGVVYQNTPEIAALYTPAVPLSLKQKLKMGQVWAVPDIEIDLSVDITPVWEIKMAAIHCHTTQLSTTPLMSASEEKQRLFFGREYFVKAAERDPAIDFFSEILIPHDPRRVLF